MSPRPDTRLDPDTLSQELTRAEESTFRKTVRLHEIPPGLPQYAIAAAVVGFIVVLSYPVSPIVGYQTVSLLLLLTVALLSLKLRAGPVLLGAAISALAWNFFFIPPRFTLAIELVQDGLMFVAYFAIAAITGTLTARIREREKAVRFREERATALYTLTRDLSNAQNQDEVAKAAVTNIRKFFKAEVAVFLSDLDGEIFTTAHQASTFAADEREFEVAAWVYWNEKKAGEATATLPFATATYYPMSGPRYPLGVIGVRSSYGGGFTLDQETLLENFVGQIASTLEREQLHEMAKRSIVSVEAERLYKTLFNSLSHELRTPIAAIMSGSDGLLQVTTATTDDVRKELSTEIRTAAERLNRLVENLLDMTRLESGRIRPNRDWCDLHDLITASIRKLAQELSNHDVVVTIPADISLVKLDFGLMEQAITNLLHNASLYTPPGTRIQVIVSMRDRDCIIEVTDNGPGFSKEALARIFEKFYRVPGTGPGGTGLGLSIVRGFVEANGGTIKAGNNLEGGAQFIITLPTLGEQEKETHTQP
jgi:two-component system sensor histidine kinase KdpD